LLQGIESGAVNQNVYEKGINNTLERTAQMVSSSNYDASSRMHADSDNAEDEDSGGKGKRKVDKSTLREMYSSALTVFQPNGGACPNDRLWFKTNLKLGQLLYEMNELDELHTVIKELFRGQQAKQTNGDGAGAESRYVGTHMLEIYALQIQLYSRQKDNKKLRDLFDRAMRVEGGIPHPRTLALIQEMGGKMHMASKEFEAAGKTFFQAFKSYDEAGDPSRLRCLKYLVMASMLHASSINPFDSQEARPYKDDPEIVAMTNLVQAFHNNDIRAFERILQRNEGQIMDDEFVREYLADLLRTIRTQVIQKVIQPCM
jgi:COP9 signalosome complex subunit 2